uniref:Uncharacterized protein n=1 Tax=Sipha flava TaxID=143950 RepID=A0A2S2QSU0_9HEMI
METPQRTWFMGYFEEENTYSVIPNNWIYHQNNVVYCKWLRKQKVTKNMLIDSVEPSNNWLLYPVKFVEGFCFDNYDEAAKKEREIFLSASESEHINYKISNSKSCSSRKLFDTIDNSDSSNDDDPPIKIMKKYNETKSIANNSLIDVQKESYSCSVESNSSISMGPMSSFVSNDKHSKQTLEKSSKAKTLPASLCSNQEIVYNVEQSSNISPGPPVQISSSTYVSCK